MSMTMDQRSGQKVNPYAGLGQGDCVPVMGSSLQNFPRPPAEEPTPDPMILARLGILTSHVGELETAVKILADRLSGVLSPAHQENQAATGVIEKPAQMSPLAETLLGLASRVGRADAAIRWILDRLEL